MGLSAQNFFARKVVPKKCFVRNFAFLDENFSTTGKIFDNFPTALNLGTGITAPARSAAPTLVSSLL